MNEVRERPQVGTLLRDWRQRRRLSQLDLALDAGVSARHLSFVETGRSKPSPEMVLLLADQLDVPLRERNQMLLAAGYAPIFGQRSLDDPDMQPVREAIELVLRGHEPYPALVVDQHWEMLASNRGVAPLLEGVAAHLLEPPVNALRVTLHPEGMAPRILNLAEWKGHLLDRLGREVAVTGDPALATLHRELSGYPAPPLDGAGHGHAGGGLAGEIVVSLRLDAGERELSFFSTVTTFGTAVDITVAELAIESFFPADAATAEHLRAYL
jgi:transcriptional regulator with XRE-family HTH domain